MAEGIGLVATSGINEDGGLKNEHRDNPERHERPTRPKRHEMQPSRIPEHVRLTTSTTPTPAAACQLVVVRMQVDDKATNETTQDQEGETKTFEKSERPESSESPNNLTLTLISSTCSQSVATSQKGVSRVPCNREARAASTWEAVKDGNAPERRGRRKKGA